MSSDYKAIVCELTDVRQHPNADKLQIANALGYNIIVGMDAKDGDVGVIFPCDGKLSHEMLMANNLYRKDPLTGDPMGGYFEEKGRVKAVKLRGQISEGFFTGLDSLDWAGSNKLKVGDEFDTINKQKVCEKYYTPATIKAMKNAERSYRRPFWLPRFLVPLHRKYFVKSKARNRAPSFEKHSSTTKLRHFVHMIPKDLVVIFTEKKHGTSARSGYVPYDERSLIGRILGFPVKHHYIRGTRNVVCPPKTNEKEDGFYTDTMFRAKCHQRLIDGGLKKDEIVYYEIVGWAGPSSKIMPDHSIKKSGLKDAGFSKDEMSDIKTRFGDTVTYLYGCDQGKCEIYVYRITQDGKDLSDDDMRMRCEELGVKPVLHLERCYSDLDLMAVSKQHCEGFMSEDQLREGVCLRLETTEGELVKIVKYKSDLFCIFEGIKKNSDEYVDLEEVS